MFDPIRDVYDELAVRLDLEVCPAELAFEIHTAHRELEAIGLRESLGFSFDPSHLRRRQVGLVPYVRECKDRTCQVHMKGAAIHLDGESGGIASRLDSSHQDPGWDVRLLGRRGGDFDEIVHALNHIGYDGPLAIEWGDGAMERESDFAEAWEFTESVDFRPSKAAFDSAFEA